MRHIVVLSSILLRGKRHHKSSNGPEVGNNLRLCYLVVTRDSFVDVFQRRTVVRKFPNFFLFHVANEGEFSYYWIKGNES